MPDEEALAYCLDLVYATYDWIPFAERFLMIKPIQGPVVPFRANYMQRKMRDDRVRGKKRVIRLKVRRHGSTAGDIVADVVFMIAFPYFNCIVTSDDKPSAERVTRNILKPTIDHLPQIIRDTYGIELVRRELRITHYREDESILGESTLFIGGLRDDTFALGSDVHSVLHTEDAYEPDRGEAIRKDIEQAVPHWGFITRESTARGVGNHFHMDYGKNRDHGPWHTQFFPWWTRETARLEPGLPHIEPASIRNEFQLTDEEQALQQQFGITMEQFRFYRWRCEMDRDLVRQYYPRNDVEAFISTATMQFPVEILEVQYNEAPEPMTVLPDAVRQRLADLGWRPGLARDDQMDQNGLRLWHLRESGRSYTIGVDAGEGLMSRDRTVAQVVNNFTGEQDAVVRGVYRPDEMAQIVDDLGRYYNTALVNPERNGIGAAVGQLLVHRHHYPNMFREDPTEPDRIGTSMTRAKKFELFSQVSASLAAQNCKLNDRLTISEMISYRVDKHGRLSAPEGMHDDCTMAFLLAFRPRAEGKIRGNTTRKKAGSYAAA